MSNYMLTAVCMSFCVSLITEHKLKAVHRMTLFLVAEVRHICPVTVEQIWYCKETMQRRTKVKELQGTVWRCVITAPI